jgi:hypothetical protein
MQQLLLSSHCLLNTIKEYIIFYEIQQCGSLHAHIILSVVKNDMRISQMKLLHSFLQHLMENLHIWPIYGIQNTFYKTIMKKQLHTWK